MFTIISSLLLGLGLFSVLGYLVSKDIKRMDTSDKITLKHLMELQKEDPEEYIRLVKSMNRDNY